VIDKAGIQESGLFRATPGGLFIGSHTDPIGSPADTDPTAIAVSSR
jgi:hypothetical protein